MLDVALGLSVIVLTLLWLWPEDNPPNDPYDDPKNWGDQ